MLRVDASSGRQTHTSVPSLEAAHELVTTIAAQIDVHDFRTAQYGNKLKIQLEQLLQKLGVKPGTIRIVTKADPSQAEFMSRVSSLVFAHGSAAKQWRVDVYFNESMRSLDLEIVSQPHPDHR